MLRLQNQILELIAKDEPLEVILDRLCVEAERLLDNASCTVVAVDPAGLIHPLAMPRFPEIYRQSLDGLFIGPDIGSCGSAIYRNAVVTTEDIENDPKWVAFKTLALPLGWRACSSAPIRNDAGKAIGAIAVYFREKRGPSEAEQRVIAACIALCELAMARQRRALDHERRATVDSLTGLPNRAAFDDALLQLRCELPGSWGLFVVDVDNLKVTNDTFGHEVGDALINGIARRIALVLAPDRTFRTGGDEFTAIIQDQTSLRDLHRTAQLVFEALASPIPCSGHAVIPGVTIGGAVLAPQETQPEMVRRNADFALYHAKETLRGGFVRYWPGIGTRMAHRRETIRSVMDALSEGRIDAQYQPVLRLDTHEIVGFEALSRMTNANGRTLPASLFQEAFADAHVASELTRRMLAIVARDIRSWLDQGLPMQHVGVNVTSADFYLGNLPAKLEEAFAGQGVPLKHLIIEVTENAYIGQRDRVVASGIHDLRVKGVRVALDDFGTGFAALTHLLTVPVDIIKIDQSFVRRLVPGSPSSVIVQGVLQIARGLKVTVVAEGIETAAQAETLKAMGCLLGQGYAFSKAVKRDKVGQLMRKHGQGMPGARPLLPAATQDGEPKPAGLRA